MNTTKMGIGLYEPIYKDGQIIANDACSPYLHVSNKEYSHWREFKILVDMYAFKIPFMHQYCGLLSPKFSIKCRISVSAFLDFCSLQSEADVIFINPFPQLPYLSLNTWMHAEAFHPGITHVAQNLLNAADIGLVIDDQARHGPDVLSYSSFWCGNQSFWDEYVGGILCKLSQYIIKNPDCPAVIASLADTSHYDTTPYLPFITERLFTSFISKNKSIKSISYPLDPLEYCLDSYEKKLITNIKQKTIEADLKNIFSSSLVEEMRASCVLLAQHTDYYYKSYIHPHTGKLFP